MAPVLSYYNVLVVNNNEPYKTTAELVAYAKAHPQKLNYGSAGVGGSNHLGALLFARRSGIEMNHIPYKATGFPIAKVAAKLAVGYTLDELKNDLRYYNAEVHPALFALPNYYRDLVQPAPLAALPPRAVRVA